MLAEMSSH